MMRGDNLQDRINKDRFDMNIQQINNNNKNNNV